MKHRRTLTIIESPYSGDEQKHTAYARLCLKDSLSRNEAPIASHLLYTQVLSDANVSERIQGIEAGLAWLPVAQKHVFYVDHGYSEGMRIAYERSQAIGKPIVERKILKDE